MREPAKQRGIFMNFKMRLFIAILYAAVQILPFFGLEARRFGDADNRFAGKFKHK
jgi:hypothetical protein